MDTNIHLWEHLCLLRKGKYFKNKKV